VTGDTPPRLDLRHQRCLLPGRQPTGRLGCCAAGKAAGSTSVGATSVGATSVETMHPAAQNLTIHPDRAPGFHRAFAVMYQRQRQQPRT